MTPPEVQAMEAMVIAILRKLKQEQEDKEKESKNGEAAGVLVTVP